MIPPFPNQNPHRAPPSSSFFLPHLILPSLLTCGIQVFFKKKTLEASCFPERRRIRRRRWHFLLQHRVQATSGAEKTDWARASLVGVQQVHPVRRAGREQTGDGAPTCLWRARAGSRRIGQTGKLDHCPGLGVAAAEGGSGPGVMHS